MSIVVAIIGFVIGLCVMYGIFWLAARVGEQKALESQQRADKHYAKVERDLERQVVQYELLLAANVRQAAALERIADREERAR